MAGGFFSYALLVALATALLFAAFTDLRRREIDNWLNLAIALGAPLFWIAADYHWFDVAAALVAATVSFVFLAALFYFNAMGGGDVKLLTAVALWFRLPDFVLLVVIMAAAGGVLTLVTYVWHRWTRREGRVDVPYGVAISFAGLWVLALTSGGLTG